ncbi:hypothetical protein [Aliarcobacter butzleri]|uniref:hypothetical protein n=1 Tax=Aliarcobacter butzleri TaxID=28197 RepID=UPI00215A9DD2|nr:hypothetical protein [Aliarcobacter butzleri]MCR8711309.1 hypothetical protein [Aliarcobacter butzleri]
MKNIFISISLAISSVLIMLTVFVFCEFIFKGYINLSFMLERHNQVVILAFIVVMTIITNL